MFKCFIGYFISAWQDLENCLIINISWSTRSVILGWRHQCPSLPWDMVLGWGHQYPSRSWVFFLSLFVSALGRSVRFIPEFPFSVTGGAIHNSVLWGQCSGLSLVLCICPHLYKPLVLGMFDSMPSLPSWLRYIWLFHYYKWYNTAVEQHGYVPWTFTCFHGVTPVRAFGYTEQLCKGLGHLRVVSVI